MQGDEIPCRRTFILEQVRFAPLPCDDEVEATNSIHNRKGNSPPKHRTGNACLCSNVVETMIGALDEKHGFIVAAHIVSRTERRPEARIADQTVIGSAQRLKFRPAISFALDEPHRLHDLESAAVVEISHARVPSPAAAGNAKPLAGLNVWGLAVLDRVPITCAQPKEMAFLQGIIIGYIADKNVWNPVAIQISEIHSHAFE